MPEYPADLGLLDPTAPYAPVGPVANGTDDTTSLNTWLAANAGKVCRLQPGNSYKISTPLIVYSGTRLEAYGATVTAINGVERNMVNNAGMTAQRTVADGAISSGTAVLAIASASSADVGRSVNVTGAGPTGGVAPLVAKVLSAVAGVSVTLDTNAQNTVSGATVNVYNRDSNITLAGGTWDYGTQTGGSVVDAHGIRFRHVDGLTIRDLYMLAESGKDIINPGDVTEFTIENIRFNGTSAQGNSGVQIIGPASRGMIRNIGGYTSDDLVALTARDYVGVEDICGDITDVDVVGVHPNGSLAGVKIIAGVGIKLRRVNVSGVDGTTVQNGVSIKDDTVGASNIGQLTVRDVNVTPGAAYFPVYIALAASKDITIDGVTLDGTGIASCTLVRVDPSDTGATTLKSLILRNLRLIGTPTAGFLVDINGNVTIDSLLVDGAQVPEAGTGAVTGVRLFSSTTYVKTLIFTRFHLTGIGNLITGATAAGKIDRCIISDGYCVKSGVLFALSAGTNTCNLSLANVVTSGGSYDVTAATPTNLLLTNHNTAAGTAIIRLVGANATPVRVSGAGIKSTSPTGLVRDGSQAVSVDHPELLVDVSILTPSNGDIAHNTSATAGFVGLVAYDGTGFRQVGKPMVDPLAAALGFINWNYNPAVNGANGNLTSQRIDAVAIWLPPGVTVANIVLSVTTAGTSTAPTGFFVGLATATTILAQSNDLHASANLAATGSKAFALNASYVTNLTDSPNGLYYVLILQNGAFAGTNVGFMRGNGNNPGFTPSNMAYGNAGTLQTALPTNGSAITLSSGAGLGWYVGVS